MDLSSFHQNLPIKIKEIISFIASQKFLVGIVGGIPRDYILKGVIGRDFDCEIRPIMGDLELWGQLKSNLSLKYEVQELNYNVIKICTGGHSIELTLPRIEHYNGSKGHSNFTAEFIADLDFSLGFFRRDLTINAIMFNYDGVHWSVIDPLNGQDDLRGKVLNSCSTSFAIDPVRFLRALRFRTNLFFNFSPDLLNTLESMDLSALSAHYIKLELSKCTRPLVMLKRILEMRSDFIDGVSLLGDNKNFIDYDRYYQGEVDKHIRHAVILPTQARVKILEKLGLSSKKLLPSVKLDESWKSLLKLNFTSEKFKLFREALTKLEALEVASDKMSYLLEYYDFDMTLDILKEFKKIKYELTSKDKQQESENYKDIIFSKRLKALNDKL